MAATQGFELLNAQLHIIQYSAGQPTGGPVMMTVRHLNGYFRFYESWVHFADAKNFIRDPSCLVISMNIRTLIFCFRFFNLKDLRILCKAHGIPPNYLNKAKMSEELFHHMCVPKCSNIVYVFKVEPFARKNIEMQFGILRRPVQMEINSAQENDSAYEQSLTTEGELNVDHLKPLDRLRKTSIMQEWSEEMRTENLKMLVCAACGIRTFQSELKWIDGRQLNLALLQNKFLPEYLLPRSYNILAYEKAILNPKGLQYTTHVGDVRLCTKCRVSLQQGKMPKFALSNWLYYGYDMLPAGVKDAFQKATLFDRMLIARARCNSITCKFNSNKQDGDEEAVHESVLSRARKGIRGNVMVAPLDVIKMNEVIPPTSDTIRDTMCAIFVGKSLPSRGNIIKYKPVLVRKSRVKTMIMFLLENNPHYAPHWGFGFSQKNFQGLFADLSNDEDIPESVHIGWIPPNDAITSATSDYTYRNVDTEHDTGEDELLMENVGYTDGDESAMSIQEMKSAALQRCLEGKPFVVSGRGSELIPDFYNPSILTWLFPHLDPWGIGGFYHPGRAVKISMEEQLSHLLMVDDSPFEKDPEFAFVFYNVCRKATVAKSLRFSVSQRQHSRITEQLLKVDPEILVRLNERTARNGHYQPSNEKEKGAFQLLSSLRMISKHVPGSDGYKVLLRNEIRALINYRGAPTLFVTLNPSDVDHPIVRLLAGEDINLEDMSRGEDMSDWTRKIFAAQNPSACARFFHLIISKFIKLILRYGREDDGVYGKCEAYYGVVEAQGKGTLHLHMLVWLRGHASPQALRDKMEASEEYRARVFTWLESIIQCEFPDSPSCQLQKRNYPRRVLHRETGDPHPGVMPNLSVTGQEAQDEAFWREYKEILIRLLHQYAWHVHQATCYKYLSRGEEKNDANCRMRMNGETREESSLDPETSAVQLRRLHPMIAPYTDVVTMLMKCNMDVKFVGSGEAAKAFIYYATDYVTKPSLSVHVGMAALTYAAKRTHEIIASDQEEATSKKKYGAVTSAVNSMMSRQEISHPQVMSYIVGGGDHYKSEKFRVLQWAAIRRFVQSRWASSDENNRNIERTADELVEPSVALVLGDKEISASNQQLDYTFRGENSKFEALCLYDFVAWTSKVRYRRERGEEIKPGTFVSPDHPQRYTHYLTIGSKMQVPVLLGPSIPNPRRSSEMKEEWSRDMMILFKPWRDPLHLKQNGETWAEAFESYRSQIPQIHRDIIANMQVLTECSEARDAHASRRRSREAGAAGTGEEDEISTMLGANEIDAPAINHDINHNFEEMYAPDPFRGFDDMAEADNREQGDVIDTDSSHILDDETARLLNMTVLFTAGETSENPEYFDLMPSRVTDQEQNVLIKQLNIMNSKRKRKMFEAEALEERPARRQRYVPPLARRAVLLDDEEVSVATEAGLSNVVEDIISEMSLRDNKEQLLAFQIISQHVIQKKDEQLLMHVAGVGGTGKSHVVKSVVKLFEKLDRRKELLLGAPTGIAAVLIGGQTLHSLIQAAPNSKARDTTSLIRIWKNVRYLIIDEVSMVGARFLSQFSNRVRLGKGDDLENKEKPYGGVNVIFMGDFAQLKPPKQFALYSFELVNHPSFAESRNEKGLSAMNGAFLWRQVGKVVELIQNQRHRADPIYADFLSRLRLGQCVNSDLDYLKTRLLENQAKNPDVTLAFWDAPIIVGSKALRDLLNAKMVRYHARRLNAEVRTYYSKDFIQKEPTSGPIQSKLWSLPSSINREAFGQLPLFIGMKVMVTENIAFDNGIVNGSEGFVKDIKYEEDEQGRRYTNVVYVLIEGCGVHMEGLEKDVVPVFPVSTRISHTPLGEFMGANSFVRKQVPLVPAYCYTDFKGQGRTLDRVMVDLRTARGQGVYVMLSRVKSLSGLLILRWFPPTKIFQRLPEELRVELKRLGQLASETATDAA